MNEKHNEATHNRPEGDRVLDAPIVTIDLNAFMQQIKEEDAWFKNDRNAITVNKTTDLTIVLVALHTNAEIKPPLASEDITVIQVLDGSIQFIADLQSVELNKGQMLTFHENILYTVIAIKETILLFTVINNKSTLT
ncbi:MAG: hypothetical protein ACR2FN_14905 [Chitinophagaceae bacterium]